MSAPYVLVPITLTDAMVSSSTAAEPAAGETAWNAATSYTVGQECYLAATHRIYTNLVAGINATSPDAALTGTTPRWKDTRATNKWAMFDPRSNAQTAQVTPLTVVLRPGIFNAIALYGLDGTALSVSVKDAPGGTIIYSYTSDLTEPPVDHWDYYFGRIKAVSKILCRGINIYADPEVTLSITAGVGVTVKCGMAALGDLRPLVNTEGVGGTQFGASAKPVTYSYVTTDAAGISSVTRRTRATDMEIRVMMPQADTDSALAALQDVLDVPAAWVGSDADGFAGLNTFGLASSSVSYDGPGHSVATIHVQGLM